MGGGVYRGRGGGGGWRPLPEPPSLLRNCWGGGGGLFARYPIREGGGGCIQYCTRELHLRDSGIHRRIGIQVLELGNIIYLLFRHN